MIVQCRRRPRIRKNKRGLERVLSVGEFQFHCHDRIMHISFRKEAIIRLLKDFSIKRPKQLFHLTILFLPFFYLVRFFLKRAKI